MKRIPCPRAITIAWLVTLLPGWLQAQGIQLTPGANMVMNGPIKLTLNNASLTTHGNFTAGESTIVFTGDANTAHSLLGGSVATSFHHVTINRSSNDVLLNGDIAISGNLTMSHGHLQLNNYNIDLQGAGSIAGENNQSSVRGAKGSVRTTAMLKSPHEVNPGNIGVEITSAAYLGSTAITRRHAQQTLGTVGLGIQRHFTITPAANTALHATLVLHYLDAELAGADERDLTLWKGADLGNNWLPMGRDSIDTANNRIVKTAIDHFTRVTAGAPSSNKLLTQSISLSDRSMNKMAFKPGAAVQVFPNPSHEQFTVAFFNDQDADCLISLYDQYGHLLERKQTHSRKVMNQVTWNMRTYTAGIYYLAFENRAIKNIKIIKE
jgi:hypothetical protein